MDENKKDVIEAVVENSEELVESNDTNFFGKFAIGTLGVAVGLMALAYSMSDRADARRIKKLEKKGYVVYHRDDVEIEEVCDEEESNEEE